jgi:hypothetical protein
MKNIILWTNCQGNSIHYMLQKYYSYLFKIAIFPNYIYMKNNTQLPEEFYKTDVFIYQNYNDKSDSEYNLSYILNALPVDCIKICIPFLQFDAYFCYNHINKNNAKSICSEFPHGKFFYGFGTVNDLYEKGINEIEISTKIMLDDAIQIDKIIMYNETTFEYLKTKILSSSVPSLFDFIQTNFIKTRLFHNRWHPTGILLNEMCKMVFAILQLDYIENEQDISVLNNMLNDWVMPILPCVKKYYNCKFDDCCSSRYNSNIVDTSSFIKYYLEEL